MKKGELVSIPPERIVSQIYMIREKKVMLDSDLAALYNVETRVLNQAVTRNAYRFPDEFMFRLTWDEVNELSSRSQNVTLKVKGIPKSQNGASRRGRNIKYPPRAFTQEGVAMLSSVLKSKQAIQVNILIMKTFVRMRELLETNGTLRAKLAAMEQQLGSHSRAIREIYGLIQKLIAEPEKKNNEPMGFRP